MKSNKLSSSSESSESSTESLQSLQSLLGYKFKDLDLLKLALTHRSMGKPHNERLEFLGDSALGLAISNKLFDKFEDSNEGELSQWRSRLVCADFLVSLALKWSLEDFISWQAGNKDGKIPDSILSNVVEAVIGAVYLDGGYAAVQSLLTNWYGDDISVPLKDIPSKDAKTELQEWAQHRNMELPIYAVENILGENHKQTFCVSCEIPGLSSAKVRGSDRSRKRAEQVAAKKLLSILKANSTGSNE